MRALVAFLFALAAAVVVGILLSREAGYVLISYGTTEVEFTLFVFILIYVAVLLLGAFLAWLVKRVVTAPARLRRVREARAVRRAERMLATGYTALAEGRLGLAERALAFAARGPLLLPALLAAARAADLAGARERRDEFLRRAYEERPKAAAAVLLQQAELDLAHGDYERALAALKRLHHTGGAHPFALRDLAGVYAALGDQSAVLDLLPELERSEALKPDELDGIAAAALVGAGAGGADPAALWRRVPRKLRERPALRRAAAQLYAAGNDGKRAAELLVRNLDDAMDAASARDYAALAGVPAAMRLRHFEHWLDRYGEEPVLLAEAGRVALELKLWGQARSYLDAARRRGAPEGDIALLVGRIAEQEGRTADALAAYRTGLEAAARPGPAGHGG